MAKREARVVRRIVSQVRQQFSWDESCVFPSRGGRGEGEACRGGAQLSDTI